MEGEEREGDRKEKEKEKEKTEPEENKKLKRTTTPKPVLLPPITMVRRKNKPLNKIGKRVKKLVLFQQIKKKKKNQI